MNKTESQYEASARARGFKKGERIFIARKPNPGECVAEGWGDNWSSSLNDCVGQWYEVTMIGSLGSPQIKFGSSMEYVPYFVCLREGETGLPVLPSSVLPMSATPMTYAQRQAASGLQVGDKVRIVRVPLDNEDGWTTGTGCGMPRQLGKTGKIVGIHTTASYGMRVEVEGETTYLWPYFVLQKEGDKPASVINVGGNTAIIIDGKATLIGHFTKAELERILPELY